MKLKKYDGSILTNMTNVVDFGAVGNGVADDTLAIQAALDDKKTNGGTIYFPVGIYKITSSLLFYSNQYLIFESGATLLQGAAINNLLMTYCASDVTEYNGTHDSLVYGATFDGGTYEVNNTLAGTVHAKNITFEKCTFKNAYGSWHNLEINSTYNAKVINCDFEGSRKTSSSGCLIQIDAINNSNTWPWPDNIGVIDSTPAKFIEINDCLFHSDTLSPAIGNHSDIEVSDISIHNNTFEGFTSSRGAINFRYATNIVVSNNVFKDCTICVASGNATNKYYVNDNQFINVQTPTVDESVQSSNMINGVVVSGTSDNQRLIDQMNEFITYGDLKLTISDFENGSWAYSTKTTNSSRIRSKTLYPITAGSTITFSNPSFKVYFGTLATKTSSSYSNASGWLASGQTDITYTFPSDGYVVIILETSDGSDANIAEYDCVFSFHIFNKDNIKVVTVTGTDVNITGVANTRYICGEVSTISITPPASGIIDVIFTSGSSVAVLTLPSTVKMPDDFEMDANRIYEINILDGIYGVVMSWTL